MKDREKRHRQNVRKLKRSKSQSQKIRSSSQNGEDHMTKTVGTTHLLKFMFSVVGQSVVH